MKARRCFLSSAFTLAEVIVIIGVLGILFALLLPAVSRITEKTNEIVCMSHLHQLWIAFSPCATDAGGWPQVPKGVVIGSLQEQEFWLDYSSSHLDVPKNLWHCPTMDRAARNDPTNNNLPLIAYLPTLFDSRPGTPNKWPSMPWFSELGNVHGQGNLTVTAEGSVSPALLQR